MSISQPEIGRMAGAKIAQFSSTTGVPRTRFRVSNLATRPPQAGRST